MCPVCGLNLVVGDWDEPMHLHHLVPRKEGGKDIPSNLMLLHEECHYNIHKKELSKAYMVELLHTQICKKTLSGEEKGLNFSQKVEAFRTIIQDKDAWSAIDRVKAVTELTALASSGEMTKKLRKASLQAFNIILSDPVSFPLLKSFYERKGASLSQQVVVADDESVDMT